MNDHLFSEFKKVSSKAWKQKIQVDLKGSDYQSLITETLEKIDIKPFYHYDDYLEFEQLAPQSFQIVQELHLHTETIAQKIAQKSLSKGTGYFTFYFSKPFEIEHLIKDLPVEKLIFKADMLNTDFLLKLYQKTEGKSRILVDPIGHLARYGNWYENEQKDFEKLRYLQSNFAPDFHFIEINTNHYKNAGAHITQEIAYGLSQAVEYIEKLGVHIIPQIQFNFAIGGHYFFEIAKLKTFRKLWQLVIKQYDSSTEAIIFAQPAIRNKTIFDPYVNMLRTSMEMMAAILGGADFIANMPYDFIFKKSNEFSERIARNQLIILQEEAGFNQALQATEGDYFIEEISFRQAEKALDIFKQIEKAGGLLKQLYKEKIQQKIEEIAQKEQQDFDSGKLVLVGTNKYLNKEEIPEKIDIYPFLKKRSGKTLIRPIIPKRLAEKTEEKRLKSLGITF